MSEFSPTLRKDLIRELTWDELDGNFEQIKTRLDKSVKIAGYFSAGFVYNSYNEIGVTPDGNWWSYNGALPFTVAAGTVPSAPTYTQRGDAALRSALAAPDSTVPVGGVEAWRLKMLRAGSFKNYLNGISKTDGAKLFKKVNANRFEVYTPFVQSGRFLRWRFDNDEGQFAGVPVDTGQGYVRPFLQTTVTDVFLETTQDISVDAAFASSAVTDIGSYKYITGTGNYFEFSGIRASRLRCTVYRATNAGIFKVTINGSSKLVNLVDKNGNGEALIDLYSTTVAGGSIFLAENLPDIDLTIRFEIVGQNPSSTGDRLYLSDLANPAALRVFAPFVGVGTPTEQVLETLKLGNSAVDYAISFRPNSLPSANTPFIGSVHGYENRESFDIFIDNTLIDFDAAADGDIYTATGSVSFVQTTKIYHPDELVSAAADVSIAYTFNDDGLKQGYTWTWLYSPFVTNGYTQMWTVYGANQGGAGGTQLGWADRVLFRGYGSYNITNGDNAELGKHITDEVLFLWNADKWIS